MPKDQMTKIKYDHKMRGLLVDIYRLYRLTPAEIAMIEADRG